MKRSLSVVMIVAMLIMGLTACSSSNSETTTGETSAAIQESMKITVISRE